MNQIQNIHRTSASLFNTLQAVAAVLLLFAVSVSAQEASIGSEKVHLGDLVDIDVVGSTEFDWRGRLSPEGFVAGLRFTETPVYALCRTPESIADEVKRTYGRFLNDPEVVVTILDRSERLPAVIFGAVRANLRFKLMREVRLAEIIVVSGGFTSEASGEIRVLRQSRANCEGPDSGVPEATKVGESLLISIAIDDLLSGKDSADIRILYGDVITVEESTPVYVMGGVTNPTRVNYREGLSLARAVASAGGITRDADPKSISIIRRGSGESGVVKADLEAIESGSANDIPLLPYDIIDIAQKGGGGRRVAPLALPESSGRVSPEALPLRVIN